MSNTLEEYVYNNMNRMLQLPLFTLATSNHWVHHSHHSSANLKVNMWPEFDLIIGTNLVTDLHVSNERAIISGDPHMP